MQVFTERLRHIARGVFVNSVGRLPDISNVLDWLACWARFSRWCVRSAGAVGPYDPFECNEHERRYLLYEKVIQHEQLGRDQDGLDFLEFGVYRGESISWWARHISDPGARFIGFDTFTGLPEGWHDETPCGAFSAEGKAPDITDSRCKFECGLFQHTLPKFLSQYSRANRIVVHLDADLYSSTLFVLTSLARILRAGDLIFFDEFSSPTDEFRAFDDFLKAFHLEHKVFDAVNNFNQVCIKVC